MSKYSVVTASWRFRPLDLKLWRQTPFKTGHFKWFVLKVGFYELIWEPFLNLKWICEVSVSTLRIGSIYFNFKCVLKAPDCRVLLPWGVECFLSKQNMIAQQLPGKWDILSQLWLKKKGNSPVSTRAPGLDLHLNQPDLHVEAKVPLSSAASWKNAGRKWHFHLVPSPETTWH